MSDTFRAIGFVSTEWLDARRGQPGLAIVDGSWHLPPTGRSGPAEYAEAHLPGAVFFDIDRISDPTSGLPHMLPTPEAFAAAVGAMGIDGEGTIVVYDQLGLFTAARVAWMFVIYGAKDVRILEGGLPRWRAEGRPVTAELPSPSPVRFAARMTSGAVADLDAVQRALATGSVQVVDARPAPRFNGAAPEPRPGVRAGHMPGSLNLPFDRVVADGALRDAAAIRAELEQAGIDPVRPVTCSCGSGVSAAIIALAIAKAGGEVRDIYDGSWAEWGSRADLPVATRGEG